MTPRVRFLSTGASALAASVAVALSVLTVLHHLLDTPALNHFDNVIQNAIHQPTTPSLTSLMLAFTWLGAIKIFGPALAVQSCGWRTRAAHERPRYSVAESPVPSS